MPNRLFTYSDLEFSLTIKPDGNPKIVRDVECINQSIRTILSTIPGERLMQPLFGRNLHNLIFSPMDSITTDLMKNDITKALRRWEDRITVTSVTVYGDEPNNAYTITVVYYISLSGARGVFEGRINVNDQ